MITISIVEYLYNGGRTIKHRVEEIVAIKSRQYIEPIDIGDNYKFIGYDRPTVQKQGSLLVCLKDGTVEIYPASNWQVEF